MHMLEDPFLAVAAQESGDVITLAKREVVAQPATTLSANVATMAHAVGRLQGFDLLDQPLIHGLSICSGQVLTARTTIALRRAMIGRSVVVLFEGGDVQAPIIVGVIEPNVLTDVPLVREPGVTIRADGERHVIDAEREIVLRCGDASITLTRAGKVIIRGNYILSRSTGYNKIKGAAIDIN